MNLDYLANKNPHERDSHITFDEGPHIYTIDGDSDFTSVTTFNHKQFEHFDPDKIIDNMMKSSKWYINKYYGMTKQEIKDLWNNNGKEASEAGTKMHYDIECYYNNNQNDNDSVEYKYFLEFAKDHAHLVPYRTEWMVYHEEYKIAGSIDMIFENDDKSLSIYDWKRCKDIIKTNNWGKFSHNKLIEHIPDTNYWHYCLQLNTYKHILESKYNKIIKDMYLVCLHPDKNSYKKIKVCDLQKEVYSLLNT